MVLFWIVLILTVVIFYFMWKTKNDDLQMLVLFSVLLLIFVFPMWFSMEHYKNEVVEVYDNNDWNYEKVFRRDVSTCVEFAGHAGCKKYVHEKEYWYRIYVNGRYVKTLSYKPRKDYKYCLLKDNTLESCKW